MRLSGQAAKRPSGQHPSVRPTAALRRGFSRLLLATTATISGHPPLPQNPYKMMEYASNSDSTRP
jgi:hypothetical protein